MCGREYIAVNSQSKYALAAECIVLFFPMRFSFRSIKLANGLHHLHDENWYCHLSAEYEYYF